MSDVKSKLFTRREFVKKGLALATVTATVPTFLSQTAFAIQNPNELPLVSSKPGVPDERVLVVVQLSGGNDGLNTVIPYENDIYYRLRRDLAIGKDKVLKVDDHFGFHPSLGGFKDLLDRGELAIVHGVGYPNPDRSHFRSMEIWQSAIAEGFETTGWVGRLFDHTCSNQHLDDCSPTLAVNVGNTLNPALRGNSSVGVAVQNPDQLYRMTRLYSKSLNSQEMDSAVGEMESSLDFLRRTAMNARVSADRIRQSVRKVQNHTDYPRNPFAQGLKLIAGMIAGDLDTKVYYISLTGFDTHANQLNTHQRLLQTLGDGISAFQNDLKNLGQTDRVLGMIFSEFGRRVAENGSRGTDHGQAAPMFIFGKPVTAGFVSQHPSLSDLADGDLNFHTDFRSVYATVLEDWLVADSQAILGRKFKKLPIIDRS